MVVFKPVIYITAVRYTAPSILISTLWNSAALIIELFFEDRYIVPYTLNIGTYQHWIVSTLQIQIKSYAISFQK